MEHGKFNRKTVEAFGSQTLSFLAYPISELIDRYTITLLKSERIEDHDSSKDLAVLEAAIHSYNLENSMSENFYSWISRLKEINGKIWDAEAQIRAGFEAKFTAEEGWNLCILVRDLNRVRNSIKNEIVKETGEGFSEVRVNCTANPERG